MALPPTIPTSFVPHSAGAPGARLEPATFLQALAYLFFGVVCALAIGVFFYGRFLDSARLAKEAERSAAQGQVDPATIESFIRLHNRLESSKTLLANHPAFSKAFSVFEKSIPMKTRFSALHFAVQEDGTARIDGSGVAQSFNVLAATSQMFANDSRIKNAVFSNIRPSKDGSVLFTLAAKIDKKSLAFSLDDSATATVANPLP